MRRGREKTVGEDQIDTISTVAVLAYVFGKRRQYQDALPLFRKACAGFEKTLGSEHPRHSENGQGMLRLCRGHEAELGAEEHECY